jgi:epoxyqueuosine reductase
MFYMGPDRLWQWQMNVARAMGNTRDTGYTKDLIRCFEQNSDARVRSMCAWALGRIGGRQSRAALERFLPGSTGVLEDEIRYALSLV